MVDAGNLERRGISHAASRNTQPRRISLQSTGSPTFAEFGRVRVVGAALAAQHLAG